MIHYFDADCCADGPEVRLMLRKLRDRGERRRGTIAVDFALTALGPFRMLLAIIYFKQLLFKIIKNTE